VLQTGRVTRFTYVDYIVMAVLSTFIPDYFLMDQTKASRLTITHFRPCPRLIWTL
jgi:hypothetical protein